VIVLQYIARPCGELFVKLFFRFFRFFFDTRCKALTARDADLAKLAFDNAALPLCRYWRVPDRYLIRTVGLRTGHRWFDIGSGSAERISSLQIPYNYLDKVFVGHLHTDHFGALHDLFVGGALMGRNVPLRVWGPSGPTPELGTAYALEHMQKMLTWDLAGRAGNVDFRGYVMDVTEFDYKGENQVVYDENGVTIRSFPAIHSIDGPVSFSLEWNGLKFVFSSDTYPNKWFDKYARDADLVVHECFIAVPELVTKMGFTPESALLVV
jgi:ribonuclease Z